ncbi:MAG: hypothetical protein MUF52_13365 [Syntrophobacteraceae bacterium]|jgi:ABC-type uncharacterized transport system substrate-binding protein|nr:hypothetical protein [Syntrophobacteraceae bacterium]
MIMRRFAQSIVLTLFIVLWLGQGAMGGGKTDFTAAPKTNNGQKWRIAYFEGGEYTDYQKIFSETIRALMKLGWIETAEIPPQGGEETKSLWSWLSTGARSKYLEFVQDAHYSTNWDDELRKKTVETVIERLNEKKDIDLLIAMGTAAGKDFANDRHKTPTIVISASDPLGAGIIKSVEDSGLEHLHAQVDPNRYDRQLRIFHEIVGFKKLGVAYEDTSNGRSYAALDKIEKMSRDRGFEVVRCHTKSDISDTRLAEDSVTQCFNELSRSADAIYVTFQGGVNMRSIPQLVKIANESHIPTFSQSGSEEVRHGFLLSISQAGFKYIGEFHAGIIARVLNGAKPNQLGQLFEEPPKIAINLKTAELIGFDPPVVLLGAADEIFREIATPQ